MTVASPCLTAVRTPWASMVATVDGETLQVSWDAPMAWEPSLARREMVAPSERVNEAGSTRSVPLGWDVGDSPTMAGSELPEHAETRKARNAQMPKDRRRVRLRGMGLLLLAG